MEKKVRATIMVHAWVPVEVDAIVLLSDDGENIDEIDFKSWRWPMRMADVDIDTLNNCTDDEEIYADMFAAIDSGDTW